MNKPTRWEVTSQSDGGRYIKVTANGRTVARVPFSREDDPNPSDAATAALISAAPELLDALLAVLDLPADDNGERVIPAGFLDSARAAVAKAEGREP